MTISRVHGVLNNRLALVPRKHFTEEERKSISAQNGQPATPPKKLSYAPFRFVPSPLSERKPRRTSHVHQFLVLRHSYSHGSDPYLVQHNAHRPEGVPLVRAKLDENSPHAQHARGKECQLEAAQDQTEPEPCLVGHDLAGKSTKQNLHHRFEPTVHT